ncbi:MAG: hypothetical protein JEZ07_13235 [Phycisphaerae bacterium]|nr:hypothetical protein [Phycisphaerae bacterium]
MGKLIGNVLVFGLLLVGFGGCAGMAGGSQKDESYAVVVSKETYDLIQWQGVVGALVDTHGADVIVYDGSVDSCLAELQEKFPHYVCFVGRYQEVGRDFVADVHNLTRKLDDDPYTDVIWGIITGYDASDALRIAKYDKPLVVKRLLTASVGSPLDEYVEGKMYSELKPNQLWVKTAGGEIEQKTCDTDITEAIANDLNNYKPDAFITSGHASEKDWNPGYGYRCGKYLAKDGQLYGRDLKGNEYEIKSDNPKVHLAIGNCLIGHVSDQQCMALAIMRSAGVYQMLGYTVPTWYGYGGWGVKDYFSELQAGRFSLAEANYVNNVALVYELEKTGGKDRGLLHDRDVVVLYGNPAWQAKMPKQELPWKQELTYKDGVYTFRIIANEKGDWDNRPVIELLGQRIGEVEIIKGKEHGAVVVDNFILVPVHNGVQAMKGNQEEVFPIKGDYQKGDVIEIQFREKYTN